MKKTVSKMVITAVAAAMTFANMMSVSASANDGMRYNNKSTEIGTAGSSIKNFVSGTWYSSGTAEGVMYYNFDSNTMTGNVYIENTGKTKTFTYSYDGYTLSMYYADGTTASGTVIMNGNSMTVTWATGCIDNFSATYPTANNKSVSAGASKNLLASGTWYSMTPAGPRTYIFEYNMTAGEYTDEYDGRKNSFTYDLNGNSLTMYNNKAGVTLYATVNYVDSETIVINWNEFSETLKTTKDAAKKAAETTTAVTASNTANVITSGTWYSMTPAGPRTYTFESNAPSCQYTDEYSGETSGFTYDLKGSYLTAYNNKAGVTLYATVSYPDSETIVINWDAFSETLKTTKDAAKKAANSVNIFAQGNWYTSGMDGIVNYFFNADSATGTRTNETTGFSEDFTYDFDGNKIVMYYGNYSVTGYVSYSGYDMIISWESGFSDTLSTVHPSANVDPVVTTVTTDDRYNKPMLAHGTWYATSNAGIRTFCFDLIEPVGCLYDFDGSALNFEYTIDGADLEFHVIGAARGEHATVSYNSDGTFSLTWASGLFETFSLKQPAPQTTPAPVQTAHATQATQAVQTTTAPVQTTPATQATQAVQTKPAPQTTPVTTQTAVIITQKAQQTTAVQQSQTQQTTPAQSVKKAPANASESPKTGDNFPALAVAITALAASAVCAVTAKKSSKK